MTGAVLSLLIRFSFRFCLARHEQAGQNQCDAGEGRAGADEADAEDPRLRRSRRGGAATVSRRRWRGGGAEAPSASSVDGADEDAVAEDAGTVLKLILPIHDFAARVQRLDDELRLPAGTLSIVMTLSSRFISPFSVLPRHTRNDGSHVVGALGILAGLGNFVGQAHAHARAHDGPALDRFQDPKTKVVLCRPGRFIARILGNCEAGTEKQRQSDEERFPICSHGYGLPGGFSDSDVPAGRPEGRLSRHNDKE
jgi:hypothetical protein